MPDLEREGRRIAAALFHRTLVASSAGMRVDVVRLAVGNVDVAAVCSPTRLARRKSLVRIRDPRIVLFAILVLRRVRIRIPPQPEILDEDLALFVVAQALERLQLLVGDDPLDVLIHPFLVLAMKLTMQRLLLLELLLIGERPLQRIWLVWRRRHLRNPIGWRQCCWSGSVRGLPALLRLPSTRKKQYLEPENVRWSYAGRHSCYLPPL